MPNADADIEIRSEIYLSLIRRHKVVIWAICMQRAHFDVERARDMVQEVLLGLWKYLGTLRPGATEAQERMWIRLRARGILLRARQGEGPPLVLVDNMPEVEDAPYERDERLLLLFERLDADDRRLMQMHLDGYSFKEIGAAMGLSAAAVRMRKSRIVRQMKQMVERDRRIHEQKKKR